MIEEFVAPKADQRDRPRQIPIKRRAQFVPSAPVLGSEYGVGRDDEMELVYETGTESEGGHFDEAFALVSESQASEEAIRFSRADETVNNSERRTDGRCCGLLAAQGANLQRIHRAGIRIGLCNWNSRRRGASGDGAGGLPLTARVAFDRRQEKLVPPDVESRAGLAG